MSFQDAPRHSKYSKITLAAADLKRRLARRHHGRSDFDMDITRKADPKGDRVALARDIVAQR